MNYEHFQKINNLFRIYDNAVSLVHVCEKCFKEQNLMMCEICKLFFHLEVRIKTKYKFNYSVNTQINQLFLKHFSAPAAKTLKLLIFLKRIRH